MSPPAGTLDQGLENAKSGCCPDVGSRTVRQARLVATFMLQHRHEPQECGAVFASFKDVESPLRRRTVLASCRSGGHAIWWSVEAASGADALALLPFFVAERTNVSGVYPVEIP
jgi:hypothetical protein